MPGYCRDIITNVVGGEFLAKLACLSSESGANTASGYSIVEAANQDAAAALAKGCPILEAGGCVEICQAMEL